MCSSWTSGFHYVVWLLWLRATGLCEWHAVVRVKCLVCSSWTSGFHYVVWLLWLRATGLCEWHAVVRVKWRRVSCVHWTFIVTLTKMDSRIVL